MKATRNLLVLAAVLLASACRKDAAPPSKEHREHEEHGEGAQKRETKASDLDQPLEKLFSERCEHDLATAECDECRYEVGVVKVPAQLFEGGLMKVATVGRQAISSAIEMTGEVRFDERKVAHLAPRTEGIIRRVMVGLGDKVRKDQPLLELESLGLGEAESQYLEAQATLGLAKRSFERQAALRADKVTSEKEYLQAQQELEAAEIRSRAASERLRRLGLSEAELQTLTQGGARRDPGRLVMRSPADGTILVLHAVPGEAARPDDKDSLMVIGDLSTLWIWADLFEDNLAEVTEHQSKGDLRAEVAVKAFPHQEFAGTLDFIGPTMEEATRTVKVRIELKNPAGKLRTGMFANVKLFLPGEEQALAAPRQAVLADEGRSFVFVHHHGDLYVRRPVVTGRAWGSWLEIKQGLSGGEKLVTDGCFLLKSDVLRSKMGAGCAD